MESLEKKYSIKRLWLLQIFFIIPIVFVFWLWDYFFNNQALAPFFGYASLLLPAYLLIFEMPHIIASFVGFFDKEYIRYYKNNLLYGVPLLVVSFLVIASISLPLVIVVYLVVTIYHVIKQLTGIGLMFSIPKNTWYTWWSWSLIVSTGLAYLLVMLPMLFDVVLPTSTWMYIVSTLCIACIAAVRLSMYTPQRTGKLYIALTLILIATSFTMLASGYIFLGVFVVRFVHDITAFLFYITHELNRNTVLTNNLLYRLIPFLPLSLIVAVPLLAIGLGLLLRTTILNQTMLFGVIVLLSFVHYYFESIMWKRNAPHRSQVQIV